MTPIPHRHRDYHPRMTWHWQLMVGFILLWSLAVGGLISGIVWAISSLPFLPVFGGITALLVLWSAATSVRNVRRFPRRPGGTGGAWPDARGTREPRQPRGPTPASSSSADPGESTGPSTVL